ncbi:SDR family oxidoreductase [Shewanella sp. AS16]|nr:SDR family oxidoreductase [Shewanella sp. AS16]
MESKTILITGGTAGIGLAAASHFCQQGHRVIITGRDSQRLDEALKTLDYRATGILCDSGNMAQIRQLQQTLAEERILLDALVLNAGVFHPGEFAACTESQFDATMDVNLKGPFFTLQALLGQLASPASVIFISSLAVEKAFAGTSVYSASKAAFEAAARVLNQELAPAGIRINSIRPGVTATEIQAKAGMTTEEIHALTDGLAATPLGRILQVEDIVPAIDYLVSDAAVGLRNAHISIDGGYSL